MTRSVLVIAHRGGSAVAPESTSAAIRAAIRARADMIELDVQMTRDGRLVVFHDDRLDRTTDGQGKVSVTSYAHVARLDAGAWFHPRFAGERILTTRQAIRMIPTRIAINLELKRTRCRRAVAQQVLKVVRSPRLRHRVLLSSFDAAMLRPCLRSGLRCALICRRRPLPSLRRAIRLGCAAWHPLHTLVSCALIATAHAAGMQVHVWTVDRRVRARQLIRWGVDGIFTNDPARLRGLVGRSHALAVPPTAGVKT